LFSFRSLLVFIFLFFLFYFNGLVTVPVTVRRLRPMTAAQGGRGPQSGIGMLCYLCDLERCSATVGNGVAVFLDPTLRQVAI
jgi:hypothetical protein